MTSKLEKSISEWVSLGIITSEQARKIHEHESGKPENSWVLSGFLLLGAVIVAIGIVSLIAANWFDIPAFVKLAGDFGLLAALAFAAVRFWDARKAIAFETLLLLFILHCLASIGLISQIFHSGGHLYQALSLWSAITFAAAMAARSFVVPFLWTGGFLFGIAFSALDSPALKAVFDSNHYAVLLAVTLLCAILTLASRILTGESATTRSLRSWILISGLSTLAGVEMSESNHRQLSMSPYFPGQALALAAAFGILMSDEYRKIQKVLLLAALGLFLIVPLLPLFDIESPVAYATLSILILGLMAMFFAGQKRRDLFHLFLFLLGSRFLILYFQALGGLAMTGVGLIFSGAVVIALTAFWNKYRKPLAAWAERWAQ